MTSFMWCPPVGVRPNVHDPSGLCNPGYPVYSQGMTQTYFTRDEAAEYMRVSVFTIDRWARDGRITRRKVEGIRSVRFTREDLDALVSPEDSKAGQDLSISTR